VTEIVINRSYVDENGMVTFICPKCGKSRKESAEHYKDQKGSIKIGCHCMNVYETQLNFRQSPRKKTFLGGIYFRTSHPVDQTEMIVRDLSLLGCKFETLKECTLVPGEEIRVEFALGDPRGYMLKKKAVVLHVEGRHVGCKFSVPKGVVDSELSLYLSKH